LNKPKQLGRFGRQLYGVIFFRQISVARVNFCYRYQQKYGQTTIKCNALLHFGCFCKNEKDFSNSNIREF